MSEIAGYLKTKHKLGKSIEGKLSSRYSNLGYMEGCLKSRCSFDTEILGCLKSRQRLFSQSTMSSILQPAIFSSSDETLFNSPAYSIRNYIQLSAGAIDLTRYVISIQIQRKKSDLETWTITLQDDEDRTLSPENFDYLFIDFYESEWVLKKTLLLKVNQGGKNWYSSKLIVTDYNYNSANATLTISGTNKSKHLYSQNQNMDPFKRKSAKYIIGEILKKYKITDYELNFDDFTIREFNIDQATPIDKIKDILYVAMAHWYWKDDKFIVVRDEHTSASGDWCYIDRLNIFELNYQQTLADYYNEITVGRTDKINTMCDIEGDQFGFNTQSLCAELKSPKPQVIFAHSGTIEYITFFDESNNWQPYGWDPGTIPAIPINGTGTGSVGTRGLRGAATSMTFSYRQAIDGTGSNLKGYKIRVTGFAPGSDGYDNPDDLKFNYHYVDKDEQKKFGVWKYPQFVDNPLIPNSKWAKKLAKWIIEQHKRTKERVNLKTALNMWMYPGDTILITDYRTGLKDTMYFVEDVTLNIGLDSMTTDINATTYSQTNEMLWK